ncbi:unnamed protein product [Periconia digitata]|uniref:SH3 domain-containing protein n=1 Tax=Periconia digitata TaxID=1303443 RepID=A0A9W4XNL2_9PLEO|nr:unnamed protein product [Periconia digitata]
MVHPHPFGHSHLVRRQRHRQQEENEDDENVVVVVTTLKNTFTGDVVFVTQTPVSLIPPMTQPDSEPTVTSPPRRPASSSSKEEEESEPEETAKPSSSASTSASEKSSPSRAAATSSPSSIASSTGLAAVASSTAGTTARASVSSAPSPTTSAAAAESSDNGGMSGGAKAGLALGILIGVGALLVGILFMYRKKKNAQAGKNDDDEKFAMQNAPQPPAPQVTTMPAFNEPIQSTSPSTAPQLSLRPVTQFDPALPNGGLAATAAVPLAGSTDRSASPNQGHSAWERPGTANAANAPANPFNDPQPPRSNSPAQNPFENSAAIPLSPTSPMAANSATQPNANFANPAPAIAAAAAVAAAAPAARSAQAPKEPASPAWTDDIPASPGPAPSGPLPIAANARPRNGPAPGPNNVHRVQLDFKPSMSDELGLRAGQLVRMLHEYDDGWALCVRMDRSQQGVVPRTCLSKLPVKPRTGPPRQQTPPGGPGSPRMRGPPPPLGAQPRPLSPASGRNSPHPPMLSSGNGRMSPGPRTMSPGPNRQQQPPQGRNRSHSNAPRAASPGPHSMAPPQMGRPRSNSAGGAARREPQQGHGPSPMNPNAAANANVNASAPMPTRKPLPGQAI